jgi:hypothetical protein
MHCTDLELAILHQLSMQAVLAGIRWSPIRVYVIVALVLRPVVGVRYVLMIGPRTVHITQLRASLREGVQRFF